MSTILLVFIEPTPYILGLINALISNQSRTTRVIFLYENLSQNWALTLNKSWLVLPTSFMDKVLFIKNLFHKEHYDLIHLAGWASVWLIFILFLAKRRRIPVVMESDTPAHLHTKRWKRIVKRLLYPRLFKSVDLFMPGGTRQVKYLESYGVPVWRSVPVNMTVDIVRIKQHAKTLTTKDKQLFRDVYTIPKNDVLFLFVGRLEARKGIVDLINALNQMNSTGISLLIIGDGSLRAMIEHVTEVNHTIRYAGRLVENKLIQAYYAADVVVLPAYSEAWGLVINEAMALGCPVIVSDVVGCVDDLVVHLETGIIIKPGCIDDLGWAMQYMKNNPDMRQSMRIRSKKKIADWTLENQAKKISRAWDGVICL